MCLAVFLSSFIVTRKALSVTSPLRTPRQMQLSFSYHGFGHKISSRVLPHPNCPTPEATSAGPQRQWGNGHSVACRRWLARNCEHDKLSSMGLSQGALMGSVLWPKGPRRSLPFSYTIFLGAGRYLFPEQPEGDRALPAFVQHRTCISKQRGLLC